MSERNNHLPPTGHSAAPSGRNRTNEPPNVLDAMPATLAAAPSNLPGPSAQSPMISSSTAPPEHAHEKAAAAAEQQTTETRPSGPPRAPQEGQLQQIPIHVGATPPFASAPPPSQPIPLSIPVQTARGNDKPPITATPPGGPVFDETGRPLLRPDGLSVPDPRAFRQSEWSLGTPRSVYRNDAQGNGAYQVRPSASDWRPGKGSTQPVSDHASVADRPSSSRMKTAVRASASTSSIFGDKCGCDAPPGTLARAQPQIGLRPTERSPTPKASRDVAARPVATSSGSSPPEPTTPVTAPRPAAVPPITAAPGSRTTMQLPESPTTPTPATVPRARTREQVNLSRASKRAANSSPGNSSGDDDKTNRPASAAAGRTLPVDVDLAADRSGLPPATKAKRIAKKSRSEGNVRRAAADSASQSSLIGPVERPKADQEEKSATTVAAPTQDPVAGPFPQTAQPAESREEPGDSSVRTPAPSTAPAAVTELPVAHTNSPQYALSPSILAALAQYRPRLEEFQHQFEQNRSEFEKDGAGTTPGAGLPPGTETHYGHNCETLLAWLDSLDGPVAHLARDEESELGAPLADQCLSLPANSPPIEPPIGTPDPALPPPAPSPPILSEAELDECIRFLADLLTETSVPLQRVFDNPQPYDLMAFYRDPTAVTNNDSIAVIGYLPEGQWVQLSFDHDTSILQTRRQSAPSTPTDPRKAHVLFDLVLPSVPIMLLLFDHQIHLNFGEGTMPPLPVTWTGPQDPSALFADEARYIVRQERPYVQPIRWDGMDPENESEFCAHQIYEHELQLDATAEVRTTDRHQVAKALQRLRFANRPHDARPREPPVKEHIQNCLHCQHWQYFRLDDICEQTSRQRLYPGVKEVPGESSEPPMPFDQHVIHCFHCKRLLAESFQQTVTDFASPMHLPCVAGLSPFRTHFYVDDSVPPTFESVFPIPRRYRGAAGDLETSLRDKIIDAGSLWFVHSIFPGRGSGGLQPLYGVPIAQPVPPELPATTAVEETSAEEQLTSSPPATRTAGMDQPTFTGRVSRRLEKDPAALLHIDFSKSDISDVSESPDATPVPVQDPSASHEASSDAEDASPGSDEARSTTHEGSSPNHERLSASDGHSSASHDASTDNGTASPEGSELKEASPNGYDASASSNDASGSDDASSPTRKSAPTTEHSGSGNRTGSAWNAASSSDDSGASSSATIRQAIDDAVDAEARQALSHCDVPEEDDHADPQNSDVSSEP